MQIAGYIRVSTAGQSASGLGLSAQRQRIEEEARRRGWSLEWFVDRGVSGARHNRPALQKALRGLSDGTYEGLAVAKLDRLSRSVSHFAGLVETAQKEHWSLIALDLGMDTSTANGRMMARLLSVLAEWERDLISSRTTEALVVARSRGVRLGRPPSLNPQVVKRIRRMRDRGVSLQGIADRLNSDDVPRAQGGKSWHASTVRGVLGR